MDATAGFTETFVSGSTLVSRSSAFTLLRLRISINPSLGETDHEVFCILARFESVRQSADGVRMALPIASPSDLGPRTPGFAALV
jgi:hypothetical protein